MGPRERQAGTRSKTHFVPTLIVSLLGFLLVAGAAFGVGMMGNVSRWLSDLPDYTDANQYLVSEPSAILDANGNEIASLFVQNRESVGIDQVSEYVTKGTVATEDVRFYDHPGVDLIGIARAVMVQLTGGNEGASTITQQLVRNTILSEEQFDPTIERKVREAYIALKMEEIFSKDEILMMYLNTINFGHGAYGIEAAAQTYFSKHADELTLPEAALLVGLPNAPGQYDPTVNPDLALERRNLVLRRMETNGDITAEECEKAQKQKIKLDLTEVSPDGTFAYPYFVDYVKTLLQEEFTTDMIFKGGLTVKTTIDPTMQKQAEDTALKQMDAIDSDGSLNVGMTVIDPKNGHIKAMVGGRNYNDKEGKHTNHAITRRQPGSSFKGITLAAAIDAGMNPNIGINCNSPLYWGSTKIQNVYGASYGYRSLSAATAVSSNTGYVQVAEAIGNKAVIDMSGKLGIDVKNAHLEDVLTLTLGTGNVSTLEMANVYATFAAGGKHRDPVAITEIDSRDGKVLYKHKDEPEQVLTKGEAKAVTDCLRGVFNSSGGTAVGYTPNISSPVAGKTGTAGTGSTTTDLWFCGYSPQLSVAIWVGRSGSNQSFSGLRNTATTLPIFKSFMEKALKNAKAEQFPDGKAPEYKPNSSWKFSKTKGSGAAANDKDAKDQNKSDDKKDNDKSDDSKNDKNDKPSTGNNNGGGNKPGNNGGGATNPPTPDPEPAPEPEPEPQPEPEPEPQPEPEPEPEPGPEPEPDPGPTPPPEGGGETNPPAA